MTGISLSLRLPPPRARTPDNDRIALLLPKLLHVSPARRMTALLASEHPFLGPPTKTPPRRRLARAEVAANVAERAARAAERHKARVEQQPTQRGVGAEGPRDQDDNPLADIAQLCAAMAAEARSLVADVKRWDKATATAAAAEEEQTGGGGARASAAEEAAGKAESAVRRAELLAREAGGGSAAAKAVADARERERSQEEAATSAAGATKRGAVGVARENGASNGTGNGTAANLRE